MDVTMSLLNFLRKKLVQRQKRNSSSISYKPRPCGIILSVLPFSLYDIFVVTYSSRRSEYN
jgi:hypothetical protein